jgi:hypothetical protein
MEKGFPPLSEKHNVRVMNAPDEISLAKRPARKLRPGWLLLP